MNELVLNLNSPEETLDFGRKLGAILSAGDVVALEGELGAGKTQLVKGIVAGQGGNSAIVNSPTFVLMHLYPTAIPIYHFDTYRLKSAQEFLDMGGEETLYCGGISLIEWPRLIEEFLPAHRLWIKLEPLSDTTRGLTLTACLEDTQKLIKQLS